MHLWLGFWGLIYQSICNSRKATAYIWLRYLTFYPCYWKYISMCWQFWSISLSVCSNLNLDTHSFCEHTLLSSLICLSSFLSDFFLLSGPGCSLKVPSAEPYWFLPNVKPDGQSLGRASHKAVVHGNLMWVIGGFTFNYSSFQMVLK